MLQVSAVDSHEEIPDWLHLNTDSFGYACSNGAGPRRASLQRAPAGAAAQQRQQHERQQRASRPLFRCAGFAALRWNRYMLSAYLQETHMRMCMAQRSLQRQGCEGHIVWP